MSPVTPLAHGYHRGGGWGCGCVRCPATALVSYGFTMEYVVSRACSEQCDVTNFLGRCLTLGNYYWASPIYLEAGVITRDCGS